MDQAKLILFIAEHCSTV